MVVGSPRGLHQRRGHAVLGPGGDRHGPDRRRPGPGHRPATESIMARAAAREGRRGVGPSRPTRDRRHARVAGWGPSSPRSTRTGPGRQADRAPHPPRRWRPPRVSRATLVVAEQATEQAGPQVGRSSWAAARGPRSSTGWARGSLVAAAVVFASPCRRTLPAARAPLAGDAERRGEVEEEGLTWPSSAEAERLLQEVEPAAGAGSRPRPSCRGHVGDAGQREQRWGARGQQRRDSRRACASTTLSSAMPWISRSGRRSRCASSVQRAAVVVPRDARSGWPR